MSVDVHSTTKPLPAKKVPVESSYYENIENLTQTLGDLSVGPSKGTNVAIKRQGKVTERTAEELSACESLDHRSPINGQPVYMNVLPPAAPRFEKTADGKYKRGAAGWVDDSQGVSRFVKPTPENEQMSKQQIEMYNRNRQPVEHSHSHYMNTGYGQGQNDYINMPPTQRMSTKTSNNGPISEPRSRIFTAQQHQHQWYTGSNQPQPMQSADLPNLSSVDVGQILDQNTHKSSSSGYIYQNQWDIAHSDPQPPPYADNRHMTRSHNGHVNQTAPTMPTQQPQKRMEPTRYSGSVSANGQQQQIYANINSPSSSHVPSPQSEQHYPVNSPPYQNSQSPIYNLYGGNFTHPSPSPSYSGSDATGPSNPGCSPTSTIHSPFSAHLADETMYPDTTFKQFDNNINSGDMISIIADLENQPDISQYQQGGGYNPTTSDSYFPYAPDVLPYGGSGEVPNNYNHTYCNGLSIPATTTNYDQFAREQGWTKDAFPQQHHQMSYPNSMPQHNTNLHMNANINNPGMPLDNRTAYKPPVTTMVPPGNTGAPHGKVQIAPLAKPVPVVTSAPQTVFIIVPAVQQSAPVKPKPIAIAPKVDPQPVTVKDEAPKTKKGGKKNNGNKKAGGARNAQTDTKAETIKVKAMIALQTDEDLLKLRPDGETALHTVILSKKQPAIMAMLQAIKDRPALRPLLNKTNAKEQTPLFLAVITNQLWLCQVLVEKMLVNCDIPGQIVTPDGQTEQLSVLHYVAKYGDRCLPYLQVLLTSKHININLMTRTGMTALHLAIWNHGQADPKVKEPINSMKVVKALIDAGAQCDALEIKSGSSPLHFAVESGSLELVKALLDSPRAPSYSLIDQTNYDKRTALHLAVSLNKLTEAQKIIMVEYLISKSANKNSKDKNKALPRDLVPQTQRQLAAVFGDAASPAFTVSDDDSYSIQSP